MNYSKFLIYLFFIVQWTEVRLQAIVAGSVSLTSSLKTISSQVELFSLPCLDSSSHHLKDFFPSGETIFSWYKDDEMLDITGHFSMSVSNGTLTYTNNSSKKASKDIPGSYHCRMTYKDNIWVAKQTRIIFSKLGEIKSPPSSATKVVGSCHRFFCELTGSTPTPIITWFKNDAIVGRSDQSDVSRINVLNNGILEISNIEMGDEGTFTIHTYGRIQTSIW